MTKEARMTNDEAARWFLADLLVIGAWSFFGHWGLVIGHSLVNGS
jgi:hypothetical protein